MHEQLLLLLQSNQPESKKKKYIEEVKCAGSKSGGLSASHFNEMLKCCCNIAATDESPFAIHASIEIFSTWASCNRQLFLTFFEADFVVSALLNNRLKYVANMLTIVSVGLDIIQESSSACYDCICEAIWKAAPAYVLMRSQDFFGIMKFCKLMTKHINCVPDHQGRLDFCNALVSTAVQWSHIVDQKNISRYVDDVRGSIGYLLNEIWKNDFEAAQICCENIFNNIGNENVCIEAAGCIIQFVPDSIVTSVLTTIASSPMVNGAFISNALYHMVMWLLLPHSEIISYWVVHFIRSLVKECKFQPLMDVAEWTTFRLFDRLKEESIREQCFTVLVHLLLGYQCHPHLFLKIAREVPTTIAILQHDANQNIGNASRVLLKLAELLYCLMELHTGYPQVYARIHASISKYSKPSTKEIQKRLKEHAWFSATVQVGRGGTRPRRPGTHSDDGSSIFDDLDEEETKSTTGLTGLTNLGNTCYMNGVLQCLYMCDSFRKRVLAANPSSDQTILAGLQRVFAFLTLSKRPACSPEQFFKDAKPPWFEADLQHDCSEFLRYLLDQLHEQEVAARLPPVAAEDFPMSATKTIKKHHSLSLRRMLGFGKSSKKLDISFASAVETKTLTEEVYGGRITSTCVCSHCQSESSTSESFTDLTLAFPDDSAAPGTKSAAGDSRFVVGSHTLPGGRTHPYADHNENVFATIHAAGKTVFLPSMFEQLLKPERLVGSNQYRCSRCESLRDGERRVSITSAPMCLVLTLLRFAFNAKTGSNDKICTDVSYPLTLLVPVVPQIDACGGSPADGSVRSTSKLPPPAPPAVQYVQYGLTGVVIHAGLTSEGGHYYCYARHSRTPSERHGADFAQLSDRGPAATGVVGSDQDSFTDEWYMFNDEHVTSSSFADIRTLAAQFPRDTAYVLFYCRVDRESAGKGTLKERSSSAAGEQLQPHLAALVDEDNAAYQKILEKREKKRNRLHLQSANNNGSRSKPSHVYYENVVR